MDLKHETNGGRAPLTPHLLYPAATQREITIAGSKVEVSGVYYYAYIDWLVFY
jgi:hypothetical protein